MWAVEDGQVPSHLEFTEQWFPRDAASASHCDVEREGQLATRLAGSRSHFGVNLEILDLIRGSVGIDHSQVERFTAARITAGVAGTLVFFTVADGLSLEEHFSTGQFPITPQRHSFHGKPVYLLRSGERPLGLYTAEGKHFIFGDWDAFKRTLVGNAGASGELVKLLTRQSAPIILCSNPRRAGKRISQDAPFGTVISIDFQAEALALLMQEEHPTPAEARARLEEMEVEMPKAFDRSYGLKTKEGVRFISKADGRHVTFAMQAEVAKSGRLLQGLLGKASLSDPEQFAKQTAARVMEMFAAAKAAGVPSRAPASTDQLVAQLCVGLEVPGGQRLQLPFLTGVEQERVADRLVLESGQLRLAPEVVVSAAVAAAPDERRLRHQARVISTLTMSAAAAGSPELQQLKTAETIIEALCTRGLRGGPGYPNEQFKGPDLSAAERERVAEFLVPTDGYLVYKAE